MRTQLYIGLLAICMFLTSAAQGQLASGKCDPILQMDTAELIFDKTVAEMAIKDHYLYAGGSFNTVGKFSGSFIQLNRNTGAAVNRRSWVKSVGRASAIADGNGGQIVFGDLRSIGDITKSKVGIINKRGQVTTFNIIVDGVIHTALQRNGILYIGGTFSTVNGITRSKLAAINISTNSVISWDPDVKNTGPLPCRIECITESNGILYVGGAFSNIGGTTRKNIAAININTGMATAWAPEAYFGNAPAFGNVSKILKVNNVLYISGGFDVAGGRVRNEIAAIDINTGVATSWDPDPNSAVLSMASKGDTLYLGGCFFEISGQPRYSFAAYSISTGNLLPMTINTGVKVLDQVYSILPVGDTLFLGGSFDTIKGQLRKNIASFNRFTGALLPFTSHTNGAVRSLMYDDNKLFAGGDFTSVDRKTRRYLAAIDLDVDTVTDWSPKVNDEVTGLRIIGDVMYIMGMFTRLKDSTRQYIGALNIKNWSVTKWCPKVDLGPYAMGVKDIQQYKDALYIAGTFDTVNGQSRNGIARLDTLGNLHPWVGIVRSDSRVNSMAIYKDTLFAIGDFKDLGGQYRECIGAVNLVTGVATSWKPANSDPALYEILATSALTISDDLMYIAYEHFTKPKQFVPAKTTFKLERYTLKNGREFLVWEGPENTFDKKGYDNYINKIIPMSNGQYIYVTGTSKYFKKLVQGLVIGIGEVYVPYDLGDRITLGPIHTVQLYGNRLFLGGSMNNDSLGYQNAMMFLEPLVFPDVRLVTDSSSICKGAKTTIRAFSTLTYGVNYEWLLNGNKINNVLPYYTYTPSDKDSIKCIVHDQPNICRWDTWDTSNTIHYKVMPVVTPDITIAGPTEEESGKTVTIKAIIKDADTGYTIEWFNRGASMGTTKADSISYIKGTGKDSIYAIITPRTDTCYVTDTSSLIEVGAKDETGIRSAKGGDDRVMIYPNPFDTYVKIKGVEQGDVLLLYDVTGRKISTSSVPGTDPEYLLSTTILKTGVYVLKLMDKEGLTRKTILIQKQ